MTGWFNITRGLALMPGLLLGALLLPGCSERKPAGGDALLCTAETTAIQDIQGQAYRSPLEHSYQLVSGVVTQVHAGAGYYIEQPGAPSGDAVSSAIFIRSHRGVQGLAVGDRVVAGGTVSELGSKRDTLTGLENVDRFTVCDRGLPLPLTPAELPLSNPEREALEGMRITFPQDLYVTDTYSARHGELTLSPGAGLRVPTEDFSWGDRAKQLARGNRNRALAVHIDEWADHPLPAGSRLSGLTGILGQRRDRQQLLAESMPRSAPVDPVPVEPSAGHRLRIVSANLLNFFNGDGHGGGFPTERGAESAPAFRAQSSRIRAAFAELRPDLVAVQELENDGFGRRSAAQSLLDLLGDGFAVVETPNNRVGSDVIAVGLFYRTAMLEAVGPPHRLAEGPFNNMSRVPLAQVFRDRATGTVFLAAVNHLKSKGSCPDSRENANADRGQGCWNPVRLQSVQTLLPWLDRIANEAGTDLVLVMGDMNAYRREDPILQFEKAGFIELVEQHSGLPQYSYRYFGQAGTLDYLFATPALARRSARAFIWHINADWPQGMELPRPWLRMSDHDPAVVDLDLRTTP